MALAVVDATQETELAEQYGVQGFPTLKWFEDGALTDRDIWARDREQLVAWVHKNAGDPTTVITDAVGAEQLSASYPDLVPPAARFVNPPRGTPTLSGPRTPAPRRAPHASRSGGGHRV